MPSPRSESRPRARRSRAAAWLVAISVLAAACGLPGRAGPAPGGDEEEGTAAVPGDAAVSVPEPASPAARGDDLLEGPGSPLFRRALRLLGEERFAAADSALRSVVARCARGEEVGRALLVLSSTYLDARNPRAHPDSAALMAARYLYRHDTPELGRRWAETLYVQALDRGADPGLRPTLPAHAFRAAAEACGEGSPAAVSLPVLETRVYSERLHQMTLRLDSLAAAHEEALSRVQELEAELERIRRLLQDPDTAGGPWPPR